MDAMTKIVIATVLVLEIIICALSVLTINSVNQGILTAKTGYVVSKDLIAGSSSTIYSINIYLNNTSTNITLYIYNDKTLYDSITVGETYSFTCLQSFQSKMELIQYAAVKNE